MTLARRPPTVGIAICAYCAWQSASLVQPWISSPYDRFGWVAFMIWCTPVLLYWLFLTDTCLLRPPERPLLLGFGLLFSVQGMISSFNVFQHMGLALAVAGMMPHSRAHLLWLSSSLTWMPVFGWLGGRHFPEFIHLGRFLLVTIPTVWMVQELGRNAGREEV